MNGLMRLSTVLGMSLVIGACTASPGPDAHPHATVPKGQAHHGHTTVTHTLDVQPASATMALDLQALRSIDAIIPSLLQKNVVYVGEIHDRLDHHLNQLYILKRLHEEKPDLVIGVEWFQQPFQQHLDDYIAGKIDEGELLTKTDYFGRWRFDFRLYRPILAFAREKGIRILALNAPQELTQRVASVGLEGLNEEEKAQLPDQIDRSDEAYAKRLHKIFAMHPQGSRQFERFQSVQLIWDESMAERAAQQLQEQPERDMVIFAGGGHLIYGSGIPQRVDRRVDVEQAIVLSHMEGTPDSDMADFLLMSVAQKVPPSGKLGIFLKDADGGGVLVEKFASKSGAKDAGLEEGDVITQIGDRKIKAFADVKLALMNAKPGETVNVTYRHKRFLLGEKEQRVDVILK